MIAQLSRGIWAANVLAHEISLFKSMTGGWLDDSPSASQSLLPRRTRAQIRMQSMRSDLRNVPGQIHSDTQMY